MSAAVSHGDAEIPLQHVRPLDLASTAHLDRHYEKEAGSDASSDTDALLAEHEQLMNEGHEKHLPDDDADDPATMVRKVVSETDDPSLPTLTIRVIVLGLIFCVLGSGTSQLMFFKSNPVAFSSYFVILITLPLGRLCAAYLPHRHIFGHPLNPGPFSHKEHMLITIIASSGSAAAYAGDVIVIQDLYYHTDLGAFGGMLLMLTTQMIGFGLAGLLYNLLVRPTAMVWPSTLVVVTLFDTLHGKEGALTQSRLRFFTAAFLACFVWQFFPAVLAPLLTSIAVLCLIDNSSSVMRVFGSGYSGYGLFNLSLDWSVISSAGGMYTPFWASLNCWFLAPLLYFGFNLWQAQSFDSPVGPRLYDRNHGKVRRVARLLRHPLTYPLFNVSAVIRPDLTLDEAAFAELGPVLLTPFFAFTYAGSFAILTSAVSTVCLYHWRTVRDAFSTSRRAGAGPPPDVHVAMLERHYDPVPGSWYALMLGIPLAGSVYLCLFYPLQLPVWGLFLAIAIAATFLVPCGIIAATTNTTIGLNVITELVAGFLLPGRPIGNVVFKCWGYMTMSQALGLVGDLKLALYSKIPPRHMFICQSLGTAVGSLVNYFVLKSVIATKRPYLDGTLVDPSGQWDGRAPAIFYSASVIWGLIGPARFFGGQYEILYAGFLLGAVLPVIPWFIGRRYPHLRKRWSLDYISFPLMLHGAIGPPQIPTNIITLGFVSAYLSQYWALRRHPKWHQKYNYVLSAALDAATSVNALVVYAMGFSAAASWWNSPIDSEHCKPGS